MKEKRDTMLEETKKPEPKPGPKPEPCKTPNLCNGCTIKATCKAPNKPS